MNQVKPKNNNNDDISTKPLVKLDQIPNGPSSGLFLDLKRNKVTKYLLASILSVVAISSIAFGLSLSQNSDSPKTAKASVSIQPRVIIDSVSIATTNYSVAFTTIEYNNAVGGMHTHFYFNNEDSSVTNKMYTGASPYIFPIGTELLTNQTQLCAIVANSDHSIIPNSGNCVDLPSLSSILEGTFASAGVTNFQVVNTQSGANITYNTAAATSETIAIGLTASTTAPVEVATNTTPSTNHTIELSNLLPCTNYYFTLTINISGQNIILPVQTFNSGGCQGGINPERTVSETIVSTLSQVLSSLDSNAKGITLNIPAGTFPEDRVLQITKLEGAVNISTLGLTTAPALPDGLNPVSSHIYEIKNYINGIDAPSTNFALPINFTINYTPLDIAGLNPSSITVKSWDGTIWKDHVCTNDSTLGRLSCETDHFTTFVLAGIPNAPVSLSCAETDPCALFEPGMTFSPLQAVARRYGASGGANTSDLILTLNDGRLEIASLCTFRYKFRTDSTWRILATDVAYNTSTGCSASLLSANQILFNVDFEITARTGTTNYFLGYTNYDFRAGSIGVSSIGGVGL